MVKQNLQMLSCNKMVDLKKGDYHFIQDGDGAQWAEPSIDDLAKRMRQAIERSVDPKYSKDIKAYAAQTFAPKRTGELLAERLAALKSILPS